MCVFKRLICLPTLHQVFLLKCLVPSFIQLTQLTPHGGVSILIHQGTQFSCSQSIIDPEGRYVFLLCNIYGLSCTIAGVYIPPPFSPEILKTLASFMVCFSSVPLLVVGDFNTFLDPLLDKLSASPLVHSASGRPTPFACLRVKLGLTDVWRDQPKH